MHAGLVWLDGEKMSKSLGNLVFVRDALREHRADTLRWYLLSEHYREEFDYHHDALGRYAALVDEFSRAIQARGGSGTALDLARGFDELVAAMDDDLNTPAALAVLHTMIGDTLAAAAEGRDVERATALLREAATMFGFRLTA
jgi:L-cysteine:1D-myo-inositol 2-amino-2-deoxy-alpha-D-glucopyranoside ligase